MAAVRRNRSNTSTPSWTRAGGLGPWARDWEEGRLAWDGRRDGWDQRGAPEDGAFRRREGGITVPDGGVSNGLVTAGILDLRVGGQARPGRRTGVGTIRWRAVIKRYRC